jgi:hypothetical protein
MDNKPFLINIDNFILPVEYLFCSTPGVNADGIITMPTLTFTVPGKGVMSIHVTDSVYKKVIACFTESQKANAKEEAKSIKQLPVDVSPASQTAKPKSTRAAIISAAKDDSTWEVTLCKGNFKLGTVEAVSERAASTKAKAKFNIGAKSRITVTKVNVAYNAKPEWNVFDSSGKLVCSVYANDRVGAATQLTKQFGATTVTSFKIVKKG